MSKFIYRILVASIIASAAVGINQSSSQAYNLEACAKNPLVSVPNRINLLKPVTPKMRNCIPKIGQLSKQWNRYANNLQRQIGVIKIGNDGRSKVSSIFYYPGSNHIEVRGSIRAKHTWKVTIPAVKTKVPVDKWKWKKIAYPDVRWKKHCWKRFWGGKTCIKKPEPFTNYRKEKVPYVKWEIRTITPAKRVSESASASCSLNYDYYLSSGTSNEEVSCGKGLLGSYKINLSPIKALLRGDVPTLGQLVSAVSITPPAFKDNNQDTYSSIKSKVHRNHNNSYVYFSSKSFVNWASAETQGIDLITSGGASSAQVESKIRSELTYMGEWASRTSISLSASEIYSLMTSGRTTQINGFNLSVKSMNVPKIIQKCEAFTGQCLPAIKVPRLGFAVIATPVR